MYDITYKGFSGDKTKFYLDPTKLFWLTLNNELLLVTAKPYKTANKKILYGLWNIQKTTWVRCPVCNNILIMQLNSYDNSKFAGCSGFYKELNDDTELCRYSSGLIQITTQYSNMESPTALEEETLLVDVVCDCIKIEEED